MKRVTRPRGVVGAYVWDYAGEMQMMGHFWNAAVAMDPSAASLDEGRRFPVCHPEPLGSLFQKAGLGDVMARSIDVPTIFRNFDDYWTPSRWSSTSAGLLHVAFRGPARSIA